MSWIFSSRLSEFSFSFFCEQESEFLLALNVSLFGLGLDITSCAISRVSSRERELLRVPCASAARRDELDAARLDDSARRSKLSMARIRRSSCSLATDSAFSRASSAVANRSVRPCISERNALVRFWVSPDKSVIARLAASRVACNAFVSSSFLSFASSNADSALSRLLSASFNALLMTMSFVSVLINLSSLKSSRCFILSVATWCSSAPISFLATRSSSRADSVCASAFATRFAVDSSISKTRRSASSALVFATAIKRAATASGSCRSPPPLGGFSGDPEGVARFSFANSVRNIIPAASSRVSVFAAGKATGDRLTKYRGSPGRGRVEGDDIVAGVGRVAFAGTSELPGRNELSM